MPCTQPPALVSSSDCVLTHGWGVTGAFTALCVPEGILRDRHDSDDMYMTFATHVLNRRCIQPWNEPV
jgi:hypothetical protein